MSSRIPSKPSVKWLTQPQEHDYPAAKSYLSLIRDPKSATDLARRLGRARMTRFKAKDILRASGMPALSSKDFHVAHDRKKIRAGIPLSPILLVRDSEHGKVLVADGYHRLCCVYGLDPNAVVPCKIV